MKTIKLNKSAALFLRDIMIASLAIPSYKADKKFITDMKAREIANNCAKFEVSEMELNWVINAVRFSDFAMSNLKADLIGALVAHK